MGICGDASIYAKVATLLELLALPIFLAGFSTPSWMRVETIRQLIDLSIGLWKAQDCSSGSCQSLDVVDSYKNDSYRATQAIQCITLVAFALSTFLIVIYFATEKARSRCFAISIVSFAFTGSFFCILSMIIWLVHIPTNYFASWSMGLTLLSTVMYLIAGCLLIRDIRKYNKSEFSKFPSRKPGPAPVHDEMSFYVVTPSPSPRYRTPSPTPRYKALPPASPRYVERKALPYQPPKKSTPSTIRIEVRSPVYEKSPRRYGTPKYSQRYDYNNR